MSSMFDANGNNENAPEVAAESQPVAVEPVAEVAPVVVVEQVAPSVVVADVSFPETAPVVVAPVVDAVADAIAPAVRRGRPKGSKNKAKAVAVVRRGRPKGSKNKAKVVKAKAKRKVAKVEGRGRPNQFTAGEAKAFKAIVRKHGLVAGCELIAKKGGVVVHGKKHKLTISLPTLSRYVRMNGYGGKALVLHQGRPRTRKAA